MDKTILILSGGLDSTVLGYWLRSKGQNIAALTYMYGQRHSTELEHATVAAYRLDIPHQIVDLTDVSHLFAGDSCLMNRAVPVPDGHYEDESMRTTVVPNRNMIMLSLAIGYAIAHGADSVAYGAHAGDRAVYPDCRPEFVMAMKQAAMLCNWAPVGLAAPFLSMTKADIVRVGADLGVPFEATWSCYRGGRQHCGSCGTCVERREAFLLSGVRDPTQYEVHA